MPILLTFFIFLYLVHFVNFIFPQIIVIMSMDQEELRYDGDAGDETFTENEQNIESELESIKGKDCKWF